MFIIVNKDALIGKIKNLIKKVPTKILVAIASSLALILVFSLFINKNQSPGELSLEQPVTANPKPIKPKLIYQLPPAPAPLTDPFNMVHMPEHDSTISAKTNNVNGSVTPTPGENKKGLANPPTSKNEPQPNIPSKKKGSHKPNKTVPLVLTGTALFNNSATAFVEVNGISQKVALGDNLPQGKVAKIGKGYMVIQGSNGEQIYRVQ